ncbi:MAG: hypothetical protein ACIAQZ_04505 [Sedimentisphaeraceae bacterium JB056]
MVKIKTNKDEIIKSIFCWILTILTSLVVIIIAIYNSVSAFNKASTETTEKVLLLIGSVVMLYVSIRAIETSLGFIPKLHSIIGLYININDNELTFKKEKTNREIEINESDILLIFDNTRIASKDCLYIVFRYKQLVYEVLLFKKHLTYSSVDFNDFLRLKSYFAKNDEDSRRLLINLLGENFQDNIEEFNFDKF